MARGDAAKMLYATEKPRHEMTVSIAMMIKTAPIQAVGSRWDDRSSATVLNVGQEDIGTVGFIRHHPLGAQPLT